MGEVKLVGTVSILNRLAQSIGFGANSKVFKPCKGVIQVRNRADGRQVLVVSTRKKDIDPHEYNVNTIQNLRTRHMEDGIATIDISEPPMSILLKGCDIPTLKGFMSYLQSLRQTKGKDGSSAEVAPSPVVSAHPKNSKSESATREESRPEKDAKDSDGKELSPKSVRRKRPRSPELSKPCREAAKRALLSTNTKISVRKRENYPKEFASTLEQIKILGIGLRKIDSRMLRLKYLTLLDLAENQLKSANALMQLTCRLKWLSLASNQLQSLPDDFFSSAPLSGLNYLNLSDNQLTKIPSSINDLHDLGHAIFSGNKVAYLPYNLTGLKSLRVLDVSRNSLAFLPETVTFIPLSMLDISNNPAVSPSPEFSESSHYVGYADTPTLFETVSEVMMNMKQKERFRGSFQDPPPWPSIVGTYLNAGKYCMTCGKLCLRYKITSYKPSTRSVCVREMARCMISPAVSDCIIKSILCYNCDMRAKRRLSNGFSRPGIQFRLL